MKTHLWGLWALSLVVGTAACAENNPDSQDTSDAEVIVADRRTTSSNALVEYTEVREACAEQHPLRKAYFGDFHLHTSFSFDAYAAGNRNDPQAALDFARGRPLTLSFGDQQTIQLSRPLDFAAVTDHAEFLGLFDLCVQEGSASFDTVGCREYRAGRLQVGSEEADLERTSPLDRQRSRGITAEAWQRSQAMVEAAYDRSSSCEFTAFPAFEYSATPGGNMNHRNVIFRNANVPDLPIGFLTDPTPQQLWDRLDADCTNADIGCDVLAIPHNPNLSSGILFDVEYGGETNVLRQRAQAQQRVRLEPLMEIYQHKGASECSPRFSSDEQCGFEILEQPECEESGGTSGIVDGCSTPLNFVRGALAYGLAEEERIGVNPFRLGIIASTDSHNSNPGNTSEEGWVGDIGDVDADVVNSDPEYSPGGLVGVWSVENSRDALFEALRRRETFGTSGPRIEVRLFAGWNYASSMCTQSDLLQTAYDEGVPMGGTLDAPRITPRGLAPSFILQAVSDGVPLQVGQIIKLWVDPSTHTFQERVYDVSGNPDNGATVNLNTCQPQGLGFGSFCDVWTDPDFSPDVPAVYYARILENPTCRWIQHACNAVPAGTTMPDNCTDPNVAKTVQERAWTSPIWFAPR